MAVARLVVEINANLSSLQRDLDRATGAIQRFSRGLTDLGLKLTVGITAPLAALGVTVGRAAADFDSLKRGLEAVSGSSGAAQEQLKRLEDIAKLPGLGFREAIQGSVRLQAVGLSVAMTERALRSFGNAVALTGGGKAELDRITVQLGQLAGKGRVLAQDMRLIMDAAPATGRALREAFGTTDTEAIQKLNLTTEQFLTRLFDALDRLPRVAGGVKNSFENLTDSLYRAKAAIGNQLLPVIVPLVDGLTRTLEAVRTLDPNTVRWAIAIAAVAAVLGPMVLVVGQLTAAVTALTVAIGIAGLAGTIATGGILLVLGALSALFVKNKLDALSAAAAADTYRASLIGLSRGQLLSNLISEQSKLMDLHASQSALRASGRGFERGFESEGIINAFNRGGILSALNPKTVPFVRETRELRRMGEEANVTGRRISDLKKALDLLNTAPTGSTPLVAPTGGGRDRFAGLLDSLTDILRDLESLQKFRGAASISLLPDDAQQQIRIVQSLAAELDKLEDGARRLKAAGRALPTGMAEGIGLLRSQVARAIVELDRLAFRYNFGAPNVGTTIDPGPLPAADRIALSPTPVKGLEELNASAKRAGQAIKEMSDALVDNLAAGIKNAAAGSSQFLSNAIQMGSKLTQAGSSVAAAAPQALAFAAAMEVATGLFSVVGPVIEALMIPLQIMGQIIGLLIVPVLKILWQPLKILGIVVSYIGEVIAKVAGAIATAIGSLVRGIGRLVNKLPGSPGDPLVKAGQAMINLGKEFKDAAGEMARRRKELENLSFDDAVNGVTEGLDRLSDSLTNVPPLFNVALRRLQASVAQSTPPTGTLGPPAFTPPGNPPPPQPVPAAPTVIVVDGDGNRKPESSATRQLLAELARKLEGASDPQAKAVGLAMRMAT